MITQSRLKDVIGYNPVTGIFTWKITSGKAVKGKIAGSIHVCNGYYRISIKNKEYRAHRLAWLYMTGSMPTNEIDHINGIRSYNRFENLREATRSGNLQNQRKANSKNISTKLLGAAFHKPSGTYFSRIQINGAVKFIGAFETAQKAHDAYVSAKRQAHPFGML